MKKKIFISGKVTGDPNYKEKFAKMEEELKGMDYIVLNPTILPEGLEWEEYMRITLNMLHICDAIIMLEDWEESKGAKIELEYATKNEKVIFLPNTLEGQEVPEENTK